MTAPLKVALETLLDQPVDVGRRVTGGDINDAYRVETRDRTLFVKTSDRYPKGMYSAEAAGLAALGDAPGGCRVPAVVAVSESPPILALEWIEPGAGSRSYSEALGRAFAAQHRVQRDTFGFDGDNFIGRTPQINPDESDWVTFFRDHRIGFQQELLRERGMGSLDGPLDALRARMDEWLVMDEPPALLHGDLWGGNAMAGPGGEPVIYDPAVYFGSREADMAMTELFGGFDGAFYAAYEEAYPLHPGYRERRDLYNLYHILNHANLFGSGYLGQAQSIVRRYL
jgi:protein-ribulosamine 3-kinase